MNLAEFHYDLPEELIAQEPPAERDGAPKFPRLP
jgi:S-adenosylmethionine:tRNA-ribosyltransferase-isomerase (queuine synthetase)